MKYHLSGKHWRRCRAKFRVGAGVEKCMIGDSEHVTGREGIALAGGGVEARWAGEEDSLTKISALRRDGTFEVETPTGTKKLYRADGVAFSRKERLRYEQGDAAKPLTSSEGELAAARANSNAKPLFDLPESLDDGKP
ncbi:hypothetical protein ACFSWE_04045 [Leucobacter albus]|uniref:Uncharacterized protein n=1 Tax=Leucobacter albus TaxID=272210 RepID=A0ABW3TN39_9MICO